MAGFIKKLVLVYLSKLFLLFGLSFIIPYLLLKEKPAEITIYKISPFPVLITAIILTLIGIILIYSASKSLRETLKISGIILLISGIFSLVISIFGYDFLFSFFERNIAQFESIKPLIITYLEHTIPKMWVLTISYIFLGVILISLGRKRL